MNKPEHLLTILAEECLEVGHRVTKAMRFGMEQIQQARDDKPEQNPNNLTNHQRIEDEFIDLCAVMEMAGFSPSELIMQRAAIGAKKEKVERYLLLSKQQGTLENA